MAMEIVNGYPCRDCTDAEKAKKGIDPSAGPNAQPGETKADVKSRESDGLLEGYPPMHGFPTGGKRMSAASTGRLPMGTSVRR